MIKLFHKHVDIFKLTVYRCVANVRHFIYRIKLAHDDSANLAAVYFCMSGRAQFLLYLGNDNLKLFNWNRTLLACTNESAQYFVSAKFLTATILLNYNKRCFFDHLESREATTALLALATAPNGFVLVSRS